ncbi:MAG: four-carbon acid sugar kinase family protein [Clostridiales bacterium]|nr:four-carbon acid sugar kinase family protein [Clostridiales bacterium]
MAVLGCIADDFTGASDAASFLVKGGMRVKLYNGVPEKAEASEETAQAIVIALKSRTQETNAAVEDSVNAARFLLNQGVRQLYFKYCSTFDSTPQGNIGPVCDALMELTGAPYTLLCPSLPVNGRTVEGGRLLVNGIPLHESHMKNHPLTPMWDCRVDRLMEPQSRYRCVLMNREQLAQGKAPTNQGTEPFYLIPDYVTDEDGAAIAQSFGDLPLLTGGSGLLEFLADRWTSQLAAPGVIPESASAGKALLIAGSCSKATLGQIAWYQNQGQPCCKIDPASMLSGSQTREEIWRFILEHTTDDTAVLAYSSDTPERVKEYQSLGQARVASLLEDTAAWLAQEAVKAGFTRIISAGGETSGAVTKGLHFSSYWMGESVAPGVPIMVPAERDDIRLILKSGNFGQEDFFGRALSLTQKKG